MQKSEATWSSFRDIAKFKVGDEVKPHLTLVDQMPDDPNRPMIIKERRVNQFTKEVRYLMTDSAYSWPESRLRRK